MVVEKLVPDEKLVIIWGDTGHGKTYLLAELATAIAMRRPAFGQFAVNRPQPGGVVVIFAAEDPRELVKSRLTALARKYNRNLEGRIYVSRVALPVGDAEQLEYLREQLRAIQERTNRRIDAIFNDTMGRSIGTDNPNDADVAQHFSIVMEQLIREFRCPVICTAHSPKSGETIAGSKIFSNNAPVTIHVEGAFDKNRQLVSFLNTFFPKYRIGPTPPRFRVKAEKAELPWTVNGHKTDLVFHMVAEAEVEVEAEVQGKPKKASTLEKLLAAIQSFGRDGAAYEAWSLAGLHRRRIGDRHCGRRRVRELHLSSSRGCRAIRRGVG
jgi:hypothetical protein